MLASAVKPPAAAMNIAQSGTGEEGVASCMLNRSFDGNHDVASFAGTDGDGTRLETVEDEESADGNQPTH